jgi:hypothetical protein
MCNMQESYTTLKNSAKFKTCHSRQKMFTTVFPPVLTPIPLRQADTYYIYILSIMYIIFNILYIKIYLYIYQEEKTPLHLAAEGGHGKIVETLVEAKADPCAKDQVSVLKEARLDADRGMR